MSESSANSHPVAGDKAVLSQRYVNALFSLAEQNGALDAVLDDLEKLRTLWNESSEWRFIATDPRLNFDVTGKAVAQMAQIANVGDITTKFLMVVAENRRLSLLPLFINGFVAEASARRGEVHAEVRAARVLTEAQKKSLADALGAAVGGLVRLNVAQDAALIGGLTVKMGSQFIDASVKTKLDRMERVLRKADAA